MREAFHVAIVWYDLAQFVRRLSALRVVLTSLMTRQEMVWYQESQCVADRLRICNDPSGRASDFPRGHRNQNCRCREVFFSLALSAKL